jgi:hypothetical protein
MAQVNGSGATRTARRRLPVASSTERFPLATSGKNRSPTSAPRSCQANPTPKAPMPVGKVAKVVTLALLEPRMSTVDGVPLAIERAAAHAATFGPEKFAAGIDDPFSLPIRGRQTSLLRHEAGEPGVMASILSGSILPLHDQKTEEMSTGAAGPELASPKLVRHHRGDQRKGGKAMPTFAALARRFLCGRRRSKEEAALVIALALLLGQQPATAATRNSGLSPWRTAQATSPPQPTPAPPSTQPNAASASPQPNAAPSPQNDDKSKDDKTKDEKTSVPATVVDGEQLESVLGIEALSSAGDNMGRIVDIIVDRSGQVRAAIIDFGGFLGVGSRKIAVDWRSLHFDPKKAASVVVNLTKDQLRVAPVYKAAEPVVMIGGPDAKPQ